MVGGFSHFEIGNSAWFRIILIQLLISRKIALADDDMQILEFRRNISISYGALYIKREI